MLNGSKLSNVTWQGEELPDIEQEIKEEKAHSTKQTCVLGTLMPVKRQWLVFLPLVNSTFQFILTCREGTNGSFPCFGKFQHFHPFYTHAPVIQWTELLTSSGAHKKFQQFSSFEFTSGSFHCFTRFVQWTLSPQNQLTTSTHWTIQLTAVIALCALLDKMLQT